MDIYANSDQITFTTPIPDLVKMGISTENRILEIGCGYGRILDNLYKQGYRNLTGIDISSKLIERAKRFTDKNIKYIIESPLCFKPDACYDVILLCGVLEYFDQPVNRNKLMSKIRSLLDNNGMVYLESFTVDYRQNGFKYISDFFRTKRINCLTLDSGKVIQHLTPKEIDCLFKKHNFQKNKSEITKFETWNGESSNGFVGVYTKI